MLAEEGLLDDEQRTKLEDIVKNKVPTDKLYRYDPLADGQKLWEEMPPGIQKPDTRLEGAKLLDSIAQSHFGVLKSLSSGAWYHVMGEITKDMLTPSSPDGNNVNPELEMNGLLQNRMQYELYSTLLGGRMELLRSAIQEGR